MNIKAADVATYQAALGTTATAPDVGTPTSPLKALTSTSSSVRLILISL